MYRVIEKNIDNGVYKVRVVINENTQETVFLQFFSDPSQEQIDSAVSGLLQSPPQIIDPLQELSQKIQNLSLSISGSRISARQIRLWLINNGISLDSVNQAISSIPDTLTRNTVAVEWEYAPYIEINHPMLVPLAEILGLTANDINRAFIEASLL